jgi:lysozyme
VGQVLSLRAPSSESSGSGSESASTTPSTPASSGTSSTYTVRSGDTLSEIADKYDVSTSTLAAWNDITNPRSLRVGDKLVIKGGTTPAAPTTSTLKYTVRSGDTLSEIASSHGVSSADLKRWNGISDPRSLRVGQVLTIQGDASAWTSHTVKRGDTLGGIASRYGVAIGDLRSWNNIRGNTIFPGQKLKLRKTR